MPVLGDPHLVVVDLYMVVVDLYIVVVDLYMVVGGLAEEHPLTLSPIQTFSPGSPFSSLTPTKKSFSRPKSAEVSMDLNFNNFSVAISDQPRYPLSSSKICELLNLGEYLFFFKFCKIPVKLNIHFLKFIIPFPKSPITSQAEYFLINISNYQPSLIILQYPAKLRWVSPSPPCTQPRSSPPPVCRGQEGSSHHQVFYLTFSSQSHQ